MHVEMIARLDGHKVHLIFAHSLWPAHLHHEDDTRTVHSIAIPITNALMRASISLANGGMLAMTGCSASVDSNCQG
jgi:hypothetical protein